MAGIEADCRVVAVDVEFKTWFFAAGGDCAFGFLGGFSDCVIEEGLAYALALVVREDVKFLEVEAFDGHVAAGGSGSHAAVFGFGAGDEESVTFAHLPDEALLRVHPFHHVVQLLGREYLAVGCWEHDGCHLAYERDVFGGGWSDVYLGHKAKIVF